MDFAKTGYVTNLVDKSIYNIHSPICSRIHIGLSQIMLQTKLSLLRN